MDILARLGIDVLRAALAVLALLTVPAMGSTILPTPADIANGATVRLQCGATYHGTLQLDGKKDVTVRTVGNCGKARISPGRAITGWRRHRGQVYVAPIDFIPVQVAIDGTAVSAAHWPNRAWATKATEPPKRDVAGATLVELVNQSVVQASWMTTNRLRTAKPFYLEGKHWMLDSPGEWALHKGRLYLWAPGGRSPEGRAWAAPDANGINADRSNGIVIDGVAIFSATDGISAHESRYLTVRDSEISNSHRDGIWASGSRGLRVQGSHVANSRRNGIDGWYWISDAVIIDSTVRNTGLVGMPTASDAAILIGGGAGNRIDNVRVIGSAYHGINMLQSRRSAVRNSVVDTACARLADCGAVYASARERTPLSLLIEGNTVTNTRGAGAIGVYLDDHANGVTVKGNTITDNERGLVIHNGFDNAVSNNTFRASTVLHIGLSQDVGHVRNNRITGNTFHSTGREQTFNLEAGRNYRQFATYDDNLYIGDDRHPFAQVWDGIGDGMATSYQAWKRQMGQDRRSVRRDTAGLVREAGDQGAGSGAAP